MGGSKRQSGVAVAPAMALAASPDTPQRFLVNDDGTVTDKRMGLMWMRCAEGQEWSGTECSGQPKLFYYHEIPLEGRQFAGYDDWRLPTLEELKSIVDPDRRNPACDSAVFSGLGTALPSFWSSTYCADFNSVLSHYYGIHFSSGSVLAACGSTERYFARLVRSASLSETIALDAIAGQSIEMASNAWHGSGFDFLLREIERYDSPSDSLIKALANNPAIFETLGGRLNRTLLHHAAAHGKLETVKYLCLNHPAGINSVDQDDITPLDYAVAMKATLVADYLRSKGARTRQEQIPSNTGDNSFKDLEPTSVQINIEGSAKKVQQGSSQPANLTTAVVLDSMPDTAQRFVDNGNGTVTDTRTNLMWMRCAEGQKWTGAACIGEAKEFSFEAAQAVRRDFAGFNDWRLPTLDELMSIVEPSRTIPTVDTNVFYGCETSPLFWTSTLDGGVWHVSFYSGAGYSATNVARDRVRLVRSVTAPKVAHFACNSDRPAYSSPNTERQDIGIDHLLRDIERSEQPSAQLINAVFINPAIVARTGGRFNRTLLHHAAAHGKVHIVKHLCSLSAIDLNSADIEGDTPLDYALRSSSSKAFEVVNFLRSKGARTRMETNSRSDGDPPNTDAIPPFISESVKKALKEALTEHPTLRGDLANFVHRSPHLINEGLFGQGRTMLHLAAQAGRLKIVNWLIDKGADPRILDDFGTPGLPEVRAYLESPTTTPSAKKNETDNRLESIDLLYQEIEKLDWPSARLMKALHEESGIVHYQEGIQKRTLLHHAAAHGKLRIVEYLCSKCAASNDLVDKDGRTPLMLAMSSGRGEVVSYLETMLGYLDLKIITAGNGSGTVVANPKRERHVHGETVTLLAASDPGSVFTGWSGDVTGDNLKCTLTIDSAKRVVATFERIDIPELGIGVAVGEVEQTTMRSGDEAFIVYLSITNKTEKQIRIELPYSSYVTCQGEEFEQDVWLRGLIDGGEGASIRAGNFRKAGLVFYKSKLASISTGDCLHVTISQSKPSRRLTFSFRCTNQASSTFTLANAALEDLPPQDVVDSTADFPEKSTILQRLELLQTGLDEVLRRLEGLETAPSTDTNEVQTEREGSRQALPQVLAWLATQERVSVAVMRKMLLPLDLLPGAVIDEVNERALDLTGEPALEDREDEVVIVRDVLVETLKGWAKASE